MRWVTRLIVLPFRVLRPDPETDFLALSLADAVTSGLSGLQSLVVRSSLAASRFASDSPDLKAIASGAEVDAVLVGTLLRAGDQLRVSSQLLELPAETVRWSHTAQVPVGDLFSLQDALTEKIVESLSLPLTTRERRRLKQDVPASPEAYEDYLRANDLSQTTRQWTAALDLYERCVAKDPHYAPAWAGMGRMYRMLGKYVENETAQRFAQAELELFAGLSHACRYRGLLQASIAAAEHARRLDPRISLSVGHTFFMRGEYERVGDFEPEGLRYLRSLTLVMLGRGPEALQSIEAMDTSIPSRLVTFVLALKSLILNENAESATIIGSLRTIYDPEARYYVARHLAYLGHKEDALDLLARVVEDGFFCAPALTRDPWLDSLRGDSAFGSILGRAEARHRQAVVSFLNAEGDRVLGVALPV